MKKFRDVVITPSTEVVDEAMDIRQNGYPAGYSCGWHNLDEIFTLAPTGTLNTITGFPGCGKSEFLDNISCHMALTHGWTTLIYSPESYPAGQHALSLIEKITGKPAFDRGGFKKMSDNEYFEGERLYRKHFRMISAEDDPYTFEEILASIDMRCTRGDKIDMVILDPWNELESGKPTGITETDYIGVCLMNARRMARKHNISFWIVAHPAKPNKKNTDGKYDPPELYDVAGSAHWNNKIDYGLIVHRYTYKGAFAHVFVKKVKKRFYGKKGEVKFKFLTNCGRYEPADLEDSE